METNVKKILKNDFDIIRFIYFCIYQIIYNITVILYEFDFYFERDDYTFITDKFINFKIESKEDNTYLFYDNDKYYRNKNILHMERYDKTYWIDNDIYYVKSGNIISEDNEKTFKSINDRFFPTLNIIVILNSIAKIINKFLIYNSFVSVLENKLQFLNNTGNVDKNINLNFFFYFNNNLLYVKDIWEIIKENNKQNILLIGVNLMYLFREFSSINLKIRTHNFFTKTLLCKL